MVVLHVRLRPGRDDDIVAWYEAQEDKSEAVRNAIRAAMEAESGDGRMAAITEAVSETLADELARLPGMVAQTVKDALANYQFAPRAETSEGDEPATAAANLDGLLERLGNGALD